MPAAVWIHDCAKKLSPVAMPVTSRVRCMATGAPVRSTSSVVPVAWARAITRAPSLRRAVVSTSTVPGIVSSEYSPSAFEDHEPATVDTEGSDSVVGPLTVPVNVRVAAEPTQEAPSRAGSSVTVA